MPKSLIIVESPAKTKTLKNFLGNDFQIEASMGHVRDLPTKELGVDVENAFAPTYVAIPTKREVLKRLAAAAKTADVVYLASDPDREGEAIAWHLAQALHLKDPKRIQFNEITRTAVQAALANPRTVDIPRVDAQEARRVLDRLVGYRISPLLWKKVRKNLSAGRVQSVAVRLICDREREILAFVSQEYWSITARLTPQPPEKQFPFEAKLIGRGKTKLSPTSSEETHAIVANLDGAAYSVTEVKKREQKRNPYAPFITSTLQQEASRKLGFASRRTMSVAQKLYEGLALGSEGMVGLITYMRTDSTRIADEAQREARTFIESHYGRQYLPAQPKQYAKRGSAQDAHEAVRPTSVERTPESVAASLTAEQLKLYRLIWNRFVASQMQPAVFDVTTAEIAARPAPARDSDITPFHFRATGSTLRFDGFMRVYMEDKDTEEKSDEERDPLPALVASQLLDLLELIPKQHFTEPPPRFTEATLVKTLEEKGIGRPSTYAAIISTIQEREYVDLQDKRFFPTELGLTVNDLLVKHFPTVLDVGFTADMESRLDHVEEGSVNKVGLLEEWYGPFNQAVLLAGQTMESLKPVAEESEVVCPNCGKPMMRRESKFGKFLGCSGYPKCKTVLNEDGSPRELPAKAEVVTTDQKCPKCGKPLVEREGKFGKFLGCSGYPRCKTIVRLEGDTGPADRPAQVSEPAGIVCPMDGGQIVARKTRYGSLFICANEPACTYKTWNQLTGVQCPKCTWPLGAATFRGQPSGTVKCSNAACDYKEAAGAAPPANAVVASP